MIDHDNAMGKWKNVVKAKNFCDRLQRKNEEEYKALIDEIRHRENLRRG